MNETPPTPSNNPARRQAALREDEDRNQNLFGLSCQNDLAGMQIHIRRKIDGNGVYWKSFIIQPEGEITGYGTTTLASLLSLAQQLSNLAYCWPVPDDNGKYK